MFIPDQQHLLLHRNRASKSQRLCGLRILPSWAESCPAVGKIRRSLNPNHALIHNLKSTSNMFSRHHSPSPFWNRNWQYLSQAVLRQTHPHLVSPMHEKYTIRHWDGPLGHQQPYCTSLVIQIGHWDDWITIIRSQKADFSCMKQEILTLQTNAPKHIHKETPNFFVVSS